MWHRLSAKPLVAVVAKGLEHLPFQKKKKAERSGLFGEVKSLWGPNSNPLGTGVEVIKVQPGP